MSLKAFHIFFIAVSTLFAFGFGVWGLDAYSRQCAGGGFPWLGIASFVVGGVLIVYGIKVFQKLQKL